MNKKQIVKLVLFYLKHNTKIRENQQNKRIHSFEKALRFRQQYQRFGEQLNDFFLILYIRYSKTMGIFYSNYQLIKKSEEEQTQRGYKNCEAFCNRLRRDYSELYQQLVGLVKDQKQNKQSISHYYSESKKLFSDQPTVIENVNKLFYHDARIKSYDTMQQLEFIFKQDKQKINLLEQTKNLILKGNLDQQQQIDLISIQFKDDPEALKEIQNIFKLKKQKIQVDWDDIKIKRVKPNPLRWKKYNPSKLIIYNTFIIMLISYKQVERQKNEIIVLYKLRLKCFSHFTQESDFNQVFDEFNVQSPNTNQLIFFDQEIVDELRIAIFTRAAARRQQTQLFKPLKDTDFQNAEHITGSYVRMHPGYAKIMKEDLKLPKKNSFEEQLFKIEDEMFEYDVNINCYRRTIKLLDQLKTGNINKQSNSKLEKYSKLSVYNHKDQEEVITLWQKNPIKCSHILRDRLNQKFQELIQSREIANQIWKITQKNNFSRSLDHRSFYFKKMKNNILVFQDFQKNLTVHFNTGKQCYLNTIFEFFNLINYYQTSKP
ncbi:unnamed protein product [Paramecium primaurelia]|uniref:Histone deacetylase interacting domain-containing protein n=1 Tax=Paramecium primaurelia TaxID=5886 RepID=A0A8S1MES3_PARPR|nr:unnamed protein product [Paramecium primaurelia]